MPMISDRDRKGITERLKNMQHAVKLINFTQELECQFCRETRMLLEELAGLSGKLSLEVFNFQIDKAKTQEYGVDKIPATLVLGDKNGKLRYFGIPAGYEFASLLDDILAVSHRDSGLSPVSKSKTQGIAQPVHLQVFVTPT